MDFSSKQAMGVIVVIGIAALVIGAAILLTNSNNTKVETSSNGMYNQIDKVVQDNNGKVDTVVPGE